LFSEGCAAQHGSTGAGIYAFQQWDEFMSYAIPPKGRGVIGWISIGVQVNARQIRLNLAPPDTEQWSKHLTVILLHALWAHRAVATRKIHQHCFDLIVRVVSGYDPGSVQSQEFFV
jgi:hypothetical protein